MSNNECNYIKDLFICSICYIDFNVDVIPIVLRCGHTVCHICIINDNKFSVDDDSKDDISSNSESENCLNSKTNLSKYLLTENNNNTKYKDIKVNKCPICRGIIKKKISQLSINYNVMEIIIELKVENSFLFYCRDCNKVIHNTNANNTNNKAVILNCVKNLHEIFSKSKLNHLFKSLIDYKENLLLINNENTNNLLSENNLNNLEYNKNALNLDIPHLRYNPDKISELFINNLNELFDKFKLSNSLKIKSLLDNNKKKFDILDLLHNNKDLTEYLHQINNFKFNRLLKYYTIDNNNVKKSEDSKLFFNDKNNSFEFRDNEDLNKAICLSLKYQYNNYNINEKIYSVTYNPSNPSSIIVYNILSNSIKKYNLPKWKNTDAILNESISMEIDNEGTVVYFYGGIFGDLYDEEFNATKNVISFDLKTETLSLKKKLKNETHCPYIYNLPIPIDNLEDFDQLRSTEGYSKYCYFTLIIGGNDSDGEILTNVYGYSVLDFSKDENESSIQIKYKDVVKQYATNYYESFSGLYCSMCCINYKVYLYSVSEEDSKVYYMNYTDVEPVWIEICIVAEDTIYNCCFNAINKNELIIFGGVYSEDSSSCDYNDKYYIININDKKSEKYEFEYYKVSFACNASCYKYHIACMDKFNENYSCTSLYNYDCENRMFSISNIKDC